MTTDPRSHTHVEIRYVPVERIAEVATAIAADRPEGYLPADDLYIVDAPVLTHTKYPANDLRNLRTLFRAYQAGRGRVETLGLRPMGVGDCIVVFGNPYHVSSVSAEGPAFIVLDDDGRISPVPELAERGEK